MSTGIRIYNPHSVISYLYNDAINNYWINSSQTITIIKYLKMCGSDIKELLYNHLYSFYQSQEVESGENQFDILQDVQLKLNLRYDLLDKEPEINAIYTLLYYSGYLTVVSPPINTTTVKLVIPNEEVANQWKLWIFEIIGMKRVKTNEIYESLFKKNIVMFCDQFPSLYTELVSCYDIADSKRCKLYETWYHSFILGTLAMYHGDEYQVLSNRETGEGRPDVRLDQIVEKKYRANLSNNIKVKVEVAIAFHEKNVFVSARCLERKKDGFIMNDTWEVVAESESA
ncbi:15449_t:CDS:2 [Funneliformis mosseae]|uniref:15449_t:CDS:1 n=1 Tax=Funneliformis mosseae TaxID=27381 RepID=A0A9N9E6T3_FUNMO|nr:15449_t:CDS:2 [Funneliformis mosseae]